MSKFFKEPLVIFLILAGALFGFYQLVSEKSGFDPNQLDEIVVTRGQVDALAVGFEKVWQRPPTEIEREGLTQSYIREEIFYREALAMGLDRNDAIVRRRLMQKLEFLSEDLADIVAPQEHELQAFLDADPEAYRQATRFSFQQVYLRAEESAGVEELLAQLRANQIDPVKAGGTQLIQYSFSDETEFNIERTFGPEFVAGLRQLEVGGWQGPIRSGFGLHLVNINNRVDGDIPQLGEVRVAVLRDWSAQNRKQTNEAFYEALRQRYKITFETALTDE